MKAEEIYQEILSEIQRKHLFELTYILAILVTFLAVQFVAGKNVPGVIQIFTLPFAFGLIHILASNILSFLYNLNWVIFPFAPKVTPRLLKIIGSLILVIGIVKALKQGW